MEPNRQLISSWAEYKTRNGIWKEFLSIFSMLAFTKVWTSNVHNSRERKNKNKKTCRVSGFKLMIDMGLSRQSDWRATSFLASEGEGEENGDDEDDQGNQEDHVPCSDQEDCAGAD